MSKKEQSHEVNEIAAPPGVRINPDKLVHGSIRGLPQADTGAGLRLFVAKRLCCRAACKIRGFMALPPTRVFSCVWHHFQKRDKNNARGEGEGEEEDDEEDGSRLGLLADLREEQRARRKGGGRSVSALMGGGRQKDKSALVIKGQGGGCARPSSASVGILRVSFDFCCWCRNESNRFHQDSKANYITLTSPAHAGERNIRRAS